MSFLRFEFVLTKVLDFKQVWKGAASSKLKSDAGLSKLVNSFSFGIFSKRLLTIMMSFENEKFKSGNELTNLDKSVAMLSFENAAPFEACLKSNAFINTNSNLKKDILF